MSEHSHIDKIFKEGLGEKKFSNADVMWQRMEAGLDKEKGRKRRPLFFIFTAAALMATGFFAVQQFDQTNDAVTTAAPTVGTPLPVNKTASPGSVVPDVNSPANRTANDISVASVANTPTGGINRSQIKSMPTRQQELVQIPVNESSLIGQAEEPVSTHNLPGMSLAGTDINRMSAEAELITVPSLAFSRISMAVMEMKTNVKSTVKPVAKRKTPRASKVMIEAVGGVDLIRLNRKAGYYVGLRMNKSLETGSSYSVGINYASHIISDRYRVKTKPADQRSSDARINNISSVRVPVYLQRQMGTSKFSMMVGLVPTYITHAEVYNVPNSYIGDPDPYRKFGLDDINRFNVLFGAGLKYAPTSWVALELSGSYGLTGMVKDGYKNLSRVNDNFKSIQLGAAFRLK